MSELTLLNFTTQLEKSAAQAEVRIGFNGENEYVVGEYGVGWPHAVDSGPKDWMVIQFTSTFVMSNRQLADMSGRGRLELLWDRFEADVISNDSYVIARDPERGDEADLEDVIRICTGFLE